MSNAKELWLGVYSRDNVDNCKQFGIYRITDKKNERHYVGSTINSFRGRWTSHSYELRRDNHGNRFLQNAWNKYGSKNFEFAILEVIKQEDIEYSGYVFEREQYYMDLLNCVAPNGFNIQPIAGSGVPNSNIDKPKFGTGVKDNFIRRFITLNDDASKAVSEDLRRYKFNDEEISYILKSGIDMIVSAYADIYKTNEEVKGIFNYCIKNLKDERVVTYATRMRSQISRDACVKCGFYEGLEDCGGDYCLYYEKYLPPIDMNFCFNSKHAKTKNEAYLLKTFKRRLIDEVTEDYLNGRIF